METINATISSIRHNKGDFFILIAIHDGKPVPVKINYADASRVMPGMELKVSGKWDEFKGQKQFTAKKVKVLPPSSVNRLRQTLMHATGAPFKPISIILDKFGTDILKVKDHKQLMPVLTEDIARKVVDTVDLISGGDDLGLLQDMGFSSAMSKSIVDYIGSSAAEKVRVDPFCLWVVDGIDFNRMDALREKLDTPIDSPGRIGAGIHHLLGKETSNGHTFVKGNELLGSASRLLGLNKQLIVDKVKEGVPGVTLESGRIYQSHILNAEKRAAQIIAERIVHGRPWTDLSRDRIKEIARKHAGFDFTEEQIDTIMGITKHRFSVLLGGPGTGKTAVTGVLSAIAEEMKMEQLLTAPTGKASKRASEVTGIEGKTIHRACGYNGKDWRVNNQNPNEDAHILFVDEMSMMTTETQFRMLDAVKKDIPIVFIGDPDQLPAIGAGRVAIDLIRNPLVPSFKLTQVKRTDKPGILSNSYKCLNGEMLEEHPDDDSFKLHIHDSVSEIQKTLFNRVHEMYLTSQNPELDIQVLTPMNKGQLGIHALNTMLRSIFNPEAAAVEQDAAQSVSDGKTYSYPANVFRCGNKFFMAGDKVMRMRDNDTEIDVYNGDVGIVTEARSGVMKINIDGRIIEFTDGRPFDLAYASTTYKAQGSEFMNTLVVNHDIHGRMLNRSLLFTGLTRAKDTLDVIASQSALSRSLDTPLPERNSMFTGRLTHEVREMIKAEIKTNGYDNMSYLFSMEDNTPFHEILIKELENTVSSQAAASEPSAQ